MESSIQRALSSSWTAVGDHKGQAVGHFKALLRKGALMPLAVDSQSRFVDQLQGKAGRQLGIRTGAETPQ